MPKRGPTTSAGHTYEVSAMPSPALLDTVGQVAGARDDGADRAPPCSAAPGAVTIWPVRGSTALRALPEQTVAPLLQPDR